MPDLMIGVFQYMAIPGLFTVFTLWHDDWNDAAALFWGVCSIFFFAAYGIVFVIVGSLMALFHVGGALEYRRSKIARLSQHE